MPQVDFWEERYRRDETPWDLGHPVPIFQGIAIQYTGRNVLVIGAGKGHDAVCFAEAGAFVTALDFSETAIQKAKHLAHSQKVSIQFICQDFFNFQPNNLFDVVIEHTFFCAISPHLRTTYVQKVSNLLHKGTHGKLIGLFYTVPSQSGPPYGIERDILIKTLSSHFILTTHYDVTESMGRKHLLPVEEFFEFQKKSKAEA